jgi:hypothetical protein
MERVSKHGHEHRLCRPSFETAAAQPPQRLTGNELNRFKHLPHPEPPARMALPTDHEQVIVWG